MRELTLDPRCTNMVVVDKLLTFLFLTLGTSLWETPSTIWAPNTQSIRVTATYSVKYNTCSATNVLLMAFLHFLHPLFWKWGSSWGWCNIQMRYCVDFQRNLWSAAATEVYLKKSRRLNKNSYQSEFVYEEKGRSSWRQRLFHESISAGFHSAMWRILCCEEHL